MRGEITTRESVLTTCFVNARRSTALESGVCNSAAMEAGCGVRSSLDNTGMKDLLRRKNATLSNQGMGPQASPDYPRREGEKVGR